MLEKAYNSQYHWFYRLIKTTTIVVVMFKLHLFPKGLQTELTQQYTYNNKDITIVIIIMIIIKIKYEVK